MKVLFQNHKWTDLLQVKNRESIQDKRFLAERLSCHWQRELVIIAISVVSSRLGSTPLHSEFLRAGEEAREATR